MKRLFFVLSFFVATAVSAQQHFDCAFSSSKVTQTFTLTCAPQFSVVPTPTPTPVPTPVPVPTPSPSCSGSANMFWTAFHEIQLWPVPPISGGGSGGVSVAFVANAAAFSRGVRMQGVDESNGPSKDYVISACPHSFVPVNNNELCAVRGAGSVAGPIYLRFGPNVPRTWFGTRMPDIDCPLTPNGTYYINVRDSTPAFNTISSQFVFYSRTD